MRSIVPIVVVPLAAFLTACGTAGPDAGDAPRGGDEPPTVSTSDPNQLYGVSGTVLEDRSHGPMLCLGAVLTSLPPQCGDVPIANWDWDAVEGEEIASGTTWGTYHVVGRYDGKAFAVTEVGPYRDDPTSDNDGDFTSPCPEPEGGWTGLDHATQQDDGRAHAYARSQPDYVTSWVTHLDPAELEFSPVIANFVFTSDVERHEAEIRKVWSGPLCVVQRDVPTARELSRIRKEAEAGLGEFGLRMLWSHGPGVEPVIEIGVIVDREGKAQAALDARYGPGVVRLIPALKPVS
jgi:hypothetical protein